VWKSKAMAKLYNDDSCSSAVIYQEKIQLKAIFFGIQENSLWFKQSVAKRIVAYTQLCWVKNG